MGLMRLSSCAGPRCIVSVGIRVPEGDDTCEDRGGEVMHTWVAVLLSPFRQRRESLGDGLGVIRGRVGRRRSPRRCGRDGQMRLGWG